MTHPKAVILNDTSQRNHHGCARVMRLLVAGLERHGMTVTARSLARNDWEKDNAFLSALADADVIVINGEGTLHHGRDAGARLLRVVDHPATGATPVALVNALWEENPPDWSGPLSRMALCAARDSDSAAAMQAARAKAIWLPDLSLSAPAEIAPQSRNGVIVGDSVKWNKRQVLASAAQRIPGATFLPTKTLRQRIWRNGLARGALFRAYNGVLPRRAPAFEMAQDETAYLRRIAAADLHITGRFHAVCLSILVETPFLALSSNASKIERLLRDAGLNTDRMIAEQALQSPPLSAPFTDQELDKIRAFRSMAETRAEALFAQIATLARARK